MQLFYEPSAQQGLFEITQQEAQHIAKVLRLQAGDTIHVTNGNGELYAAKLIHVHKNHVQVEGELVRKEPRITPYVHLVMGPTKTNERTEWAIEKCIEIGVQEFTFIQTEHSERKAIKLERFEKVAISAMKQSQKLYTPILNDLMPFKSWISAYNKPCLMAHCADIGEKLNFESMPAQEQFTILVGPEGDFSPTEIQLAEQHNARFIRLGNQRLRTETAAVVAATLAIFKS